MHKPTIEYVIPTTSGQSSVEATLMMAQGLKSTYSIGDMTFVFSGGQGFN